MQLESCDDFARGATDKRAAAEDLPKQELADEQLDEWVRALAALNSKWYIYRRRQLRQRLFETQIAESH